MPLQPAISRALPRSGRGKRYSIYTLRAAQVGHEARSLVLFRSSRGRLLLENLPPRSLPLPLSPSPPPFLFSFFFFFFFFFLPSPPPPPPKKNPTTGRAGIRD